MKTIAHGRKHRLIQSCPVIIYIKAHVLDTAQTNSCLFALLERFPKQ